jgi:hypothetical protein
MNKHEVIQMVEKHFGIDTSLRSRRRDVVDARMAIMVALRPMYSMVQIGNIFSYRKKDGGQIAYVPMSHCTVVHAMRQHKWRYHPEADKRPVSYRLYGDVYDFACEFLKSDNFKPITQMDMRNAIDQEMHLRKQAEQKAKSLEFKLSTIEGEAEKIIAKLKKDLNKVINERDHYKRAFTQLYNEKRAHEKLVKEDGPQKVRQ